MNCVLYQRLRSLHARQNLCRGPIDPWRVHHLHDTDHSLSLLVLFCRLHVVVETFLRLPLKVILGHYSVDLPVVFEDLLARVFIVVIDRFRLFWRYQRLLGVRHKEGAVVVALVDARFRLFLTIPECVSERRWTY